MPPEEAEDALEMARYTGPRTKVSRRARQLLDENKTRVAKLVFLEIGHEPVPGVRESQYLVQLREKQKLRFMYGVLEKQFRRYYKEAARQSGITGTVLLQILESRLDNVVYRSGLASTRPQARQLVNHGHFLVNGKRVDIPSYQVRKDDVVSVKERSLEILPIMISIDTGDRTVPEWMDVNTEERTITIQDLPSREQIDTQIQEQLVVELYSK